MSALKQLKPSEVRSTTVTPRKDAGRAKILHWDRYKTDYSADTGYSPAYHDAVRHKPRLCGESAVMRDLIEYANIRSYGRPRGKKDPRHVWTDTLTTEELAEHCRCKVREIQRQLSEMEERGMISVRRLKGGIEISLLYAAWAKVEDYAVWQRKQKVAAIDESELYTEAAADEEPAAPGKEAVPVFKRPLAVRPGRASKAAPINAGVKEFVFVNRNAKVEVVCEGVIESGRFTLYTDFRFPAASVGANEKRKSVNNDAGIPVTPSTATNQFSKIASGKSPTQPITLPPGGDKLPSLFDPSLLGNNPPQSLAGDPVTWRKACAAMGPMPFDVLERAYTTAPKGATPRCKRPTKLTDILPIIREARVNWEKTGKVSEENSERDGLLKVLGLPEWASITGMQGKHGVANLRASLRRSIGDPDMTAEHQAAARRLLEVL